MVPDIKYSVIIPVYNAEKTLARCLDSLLCQNRNDIQIILVNDGSTDTSAEIARSYAGQYPSVVFFSQENAGVSAARNAGLSLASGEYILFVDSDDYVRNDYFPVLDSACESDLVVFSHRVSGPGQYDLKPLFEQLRQTETRSGRLALLLSSRRIMSPCDKRYRRTIIEKAELRFHHDFSIGEDFHFAMRYALLCSSIGVLPEEILCVDTTGQDSLSRKYRPNLDKQMSAVFTDVAHAIRSSSIDPSEKEHLLAITDYLYARTVFSCVTELFKKESRGYLAWRREIRDICACFRTPLSRSLISFVHYLIRTAIRWNLYFPFYAVSYLVKGRNIRRSR